MPDDMWPLTGLPHLPKGYFWRITMDTANTRKLPNIEIRKKRLIGSKYVAWSWFYSLEDLDRYADLTRGSSSRFAIQDIRDVTPDVVRAVAVEVRAEFQVSRDNDARAAVLLGDYPPKKLEV